MKTIVLILLLSIPTFATPYEKAAILAAYQTDIALAAEMYALTEIPTTLYVKSTNQEMTELYNQGKKKAKIQRICRYTGYALSGMLMLSGAKIFFQSDTQEGAFCGLAGVGLGMVFMAHIEYNW